MELKGEKCFIENGSSQSYYRGHTGGKLCVILNGDKAENIFKEK